MNLFTNRLNKLVSKRLTSRRQCIETTGKRDFLTSAFPSKETNLTRYKERCLRRFTALDFYRDRVGSFNETANF